MMKLRPLRSVVHPRYPCALLRRARVLAVGLGLAGLSLCACGQPAVCARPRPAAVVEVASVPPAEVASVPPAEVASVPPAAASEEAAASSGELAAPLEGGEDPAGLAPLGEGEAPAPLFGAAMQDRQPARVSGAINLAAIRERLRPAFREAGRCFERYLADHPVTSGRADLRIVIGPEGTVQEVSVTRSELGSAELERCVAEAVSRVVFPRPPGGGLIILGYPLALSPVES